MALKPVRLESTRRRGMKGTEEGRVVGGGVWGWAESGCQGWEEDRDRGGVEGGYSCSTFCGKRGLSD